VTAETTPEHPPHPRRARRLLRDAAIAIVSLGVGLAAITMVQRDDGNDPAFLTDDRASVAALPLPAVDDRAQGDRAPVEPSREFAPIDDPTRALMTFLGAEQRDDFERSYALLVAEDRELFPSHARWEEAHRGMPEVTSFGPVEETERSAASVTFRVDLALRPRLDETIGVVAARATGSFVARQVGGDDWRIAFSESSLTPQYPDAGGARAAAVAWANARQRCERSAEWDGGLLGVAAEAYAESLCDTTATVRAGEPVSLDRASGTEPVLAAFGPEASIWARVVRLSGPIDLDVVTAPLGEEWVVVGVLQSSDGGSIEPS
jgi:hypothetical protein